MKLGFAGQIGSVINISLYFGSRKACRHWNLCHMCVTYVYGCPACSTSMHHMHTWCLWSQKRVLGPRNWSYIQTEVYRQLWAVMWILGIEPKSSGRIVNALNQWVALLCSSAWPGIHYEDNLCWLQICGDSPCFCLLFDGITGTWEDILTSRFFSPCPLGLLE